MTDVLPLRGVQGCVFDAYGTLFDFAAATRNCRDVLGDDIDRLMRFGVTNNCNTHGFEPLRDDMQTSGRLPATLWILHWRHWASQNPAFAIG
jgi:hypothetical protein